MSTVFGYLSEFWDNVVDVTVNSVTYTVDWFKQIGNAVAGGVGSIFLTPLRYIFDLVIAILWVSTTLFKIIIAVVSPIIFIFAYLYNFFKALVVLPSSSSTFTAPAQALTFLSTFPLFTYLITIIGALIVVASVISIFKSLKL